MDLCCYSDTRETPNQRSEMHFQNTWRLFAAIRKIALIFLSSAVKNSTSYADLISAISSIQQELIDANQARCQKSWGQLN